MGSVESALDRAVHRAEDRLGRISVEGRYHHLPRRLTDDYRLEGQALGSGSSGPVLLATSRCTGARCAVKHFRLRGVDRDRTEDLVREAEVFLSLDHPHVARLLEVYQSEEYMSLVMECMEGGELFDRVHERRLFTEIDAAKASKQMLLAIRYVHAQGIVHRDIKLENFLYERRDTDFLKLIDFGFSKFWDKNAKMEHSCGTIAYVAPEVLNKSYTSQCDMWSFGVIVFVLLMGYMPFPGQASSEIVSSIRRGHILLKKERWLRLSDTSHDFVKGLLVVDPNQRLTAEQALRHSWIEQCSRAEGEVVTTFDEEVANSLRRFARGSKFRRACMQMMAWSLTLEERTKLRGLFFELDKEQKGTITLGELKQALEGTFRLPESESCQVLEALKDLDYDHPDEIHYSEFLAATMSSRIAMHDELLEATFHRFDTEGTGYITSESLKQVLGKTVDAGKIVKELDKDHDGKIGLTDFIEYLRSSDAKDAHLEAANNIIDQELESLGSGGRRLPFKLCWGKQSRARLSAPRRGVAVKGG